MNNVPMTRPDLALAVHDTPFFHSSTFVELADGRVLHVAGGVRTLSDDRGLTWSDSERLVDTNGDSVGGSETSLVKLSETNAVGLAARRRDQPADTSWPAPPGSVRFDFWRSDDNGVTWQPPVRMTAPGTSTAGYQDTFLRTRSGRIVLPVFHSIGQRSGPDDRTPPACGKLVNNQFVPTGAHDFDPGFSAVYVLYSDDDGRTWQRNKDRELVILLDWNAIYSYCNEASVTEVAPKKAPGRLVIFMRNGLGRLFQAWSNDNGETWTRPQPTSLAASTGPPQIRTLPNGHLLCVWNQETERDIKGGFARTRLSSAVSRDGGRVWEFFQNVQSLHEATRVEPGPIRPTRPAEIYFPAGQPVPEREAEHVVVADEHARWSYPSVCVLDDRVLIAHTYSTYAEHPTRAELLLSNRPQGSTNQKLKVLPLTWFYGGKEPADNPFLREAYEPAKP